MLYNIKVLLPSFLYSIVNEQTLAGQPNLSPDDGDELFVRTTESSFAYTPILWWAWIDLNYRPHAYQACALTT